MSDFKYEFNSDGEWCLALLAESHDENNKSFVYYKSGAGFVNTDGFVAKGSEAGEYRDKA